MKKLLLLTLFLCGFTYPEHPVTRVDDYANVLTSNQKQELITSLKQLEPAQVAVAIFPTIEGNSIEDVANNLARKWKLGSKQNNDGVLLVLAMKEHKMRIEVGYGLEHKLTDAKCDSIMRNIMRPYMRAGDTNGALLAFSKEVNATLSRTEQSVATKSTVSIDSDWTEIYIFGCIGILVLLIMALVRFLTREPEAEKKDYKVNQLKKKTKAIKSEYTFPRIVPIISTSTHSSDSTHSSKSHSSSSNYSSGSSSSDYSSSGSSWGGGSDSGFSGGGGDFGGGGSSSSW